MLPWHGSDRQGEPLVIRQAVRRDAPRYLEHLRALVAETRFMLQAPEDPLADPEEQRLQLDHIGRLSNSVAMVAVRPGRSPGRDPILGSLTLLGGTLARTRSGALLSMGVVASAWGLGIGGALLDVGMAWARQNPTLVRVGLQVYADNAPARGLYRSRGFVEEGVLRRDVRELDGAEEDLVGMSAWVGRPR